MGSKKIIWIIVAIAVAAILIYSFSGGETREQYIQRIEKEREDKKRFMQTSKSSPFKEYKVKFEGLKYFDPDPAYRITARFIPVTSADHVNLPTNDEKSIPYRKYGYAEFEFQGKTNRLLILELADGSENDGHLFIPFGDATSAEDTYGAGRYLDIRHNGDAAVVELDFNMAYNPYCAYVDDYSCPLPPLENLLDIPMRAGEKTYK